MPKNFVKLENIDAMSNELYDLLAEAFKEELIKQGKSPDVCWDHWSIIATYQPIEEYQNA